MNIVSAEYNQFGAINVVIEDMPPDTSITVPVDPANKDYVELQAWAAKEGNEIKAYQAPPQQDPEPTIEERLAKLEAKFEKVMAAFDFPSSPTEGQEFTPSGGPTYVYRDGKWLVAKSAPPVASTAVARQWMTPAGVYIGGA